MLFFVHSVFLFLLFEAVFCFERGSKCLPGSLTRLSVRAVNGAGWAFIEAQNRPLTEEAERSGARCEQGGWRSEIGLGRGASRSGAMKGCRRYRFRRLSKKRLHNITPYGVILDMDQLTDVLTAISHPTRRAIIRQLANGPARFLDVAKPFDTALNAVTKHLKLLERAGLIEREKRGREVLISFRAEPLREVAGWVHEYERFWNARLDQFEQYFRDKREKEKKR